MGFKAVLLLRAKQEQSMNRKVARQGQGQEPRGVSGPVTQAKEGMGVLSQVRS